MTATALQRRVGKSEGVRPEKIPVPREHGAWFVLFGSVLVGTAAAGRVGVELFLFSAATFFLFLSREPLAKLLRTRRYGAPPERRNRWIKWLILDLVPAGAAGLLLLSVFQRWALLPFAGVGILLFLAHLYWSVRRKDRTLPAELLGTAALTLTAPAASVALGQSEPTLLLAVWSACVLYFFSGVLYVRMRIAGALRPALLPYHRRLNLVYHLVLPGLIGGMYVVGALPPWAWTGYVPAVVRGLTHSFRVPSKPLNIRALGYTEAAYSVFFVLIQVPTWWS
ncbi:MAG TPA: YwiC-like family protein [Acidobacteriota bacterium]|nr:YwiC-like family protein [Acidobacteriota bacterium]